MELEFTGERIVGKTLAEVAACCPPEGQRHIDRYLWAKSKLRGRLVLDCACGCGFGSSILSEPYGIVYGVDIDDKAIKYAEEYYLTEGQTWFCQQDMLHLREIFPESDSEFDTIVSLESLEHVEDPSVVLTQFKRLLKEGGNLVVSLPCYPTKHFNQYHLFEVESFQAGIDYFQKHGFRVIDSWNQDVEYGIYELEIA